LVAKKSLDDEPIIELDADFLLERSAVKVLCNGIVFTGRQACLGSVHDRLKP
jgi:hypothetical protein